ncbi:MAG TPA: barstar family protein [Microlunatus sp.]|jgi:RNAse (barnase) inhibitor barstar|nr:barstar family protein [Microlunatus sp.]
MTGPDSSRPQPGLESGRGGVYRILAPLDAVEAQLAADGWRVTVLNEVERTRDFYAELRRALDLPDWTGANLDALWDVLTDLTEPTAVVWPRHATFAVARPGPWQRILAVLEERAEQDPPFAVVLT